MEENIEQESKMNNALKSGGIIGLVNIIIVVLFYVVDPTLMAKWWLGILIILLNLALVIIFGIKYRKSIGGYLGFGPAYMHGLVTLVFASLIGTLFNILLYTVIDPELPGIIADAAIENTAAFMQKMGAPSDQIDEALSDMEGSMAERFTMSGLSIQFLWSILVSAVIALITGLIVKKNEPIEDL